MYNEESVTLPVTISQYSILRPYDRLPLALSQYTCTHLYIKHDLKNGDTWKMCKLKVLLVEYCLGKSSSCLLKNFWLQFGEALRILHIKVLAADVCMVCYVPGAMCVLQVMCRFVGKTYMNNICICTTFQSLYPLSVFMIKN